MSRPFAFFVHHQGRGHARRCEEIIRHLDDRPITILSADRVIFGDFDERISFVELPNAIGDPSATAALHNQQTPDVTQCVPLGSSALKANAEEIVGVFKRDNPALMINDVSVEWALLARLCSVPSVKIRMHGDRSDASHIAAYQACVGMIAPFHADLEQPDYPEWARAKTFYSGGLCTSLDAVPEKKEARDRLGLSPDRKIILALSGGGGSGANYASLTMAARALPDALWLTVGPVQLEGHETEFTNLRQCGWVENVLDYLAAADVVVASAGDNTCHEIARVGRPFLCIPEWRYYDEQVAKARELARLGAAHVLTTWPASNAQWQRAITGALEVGTKRLVPLFDAQAAKKIANHLIALDGHLWDDRSTEANRTVASGGLSLVG
ncbi:glycosyltransferase [Hasllibacter sp. MH4015]|uniref:glycosyltransferase n=1 Tax=Hasllibacter sp. MH4015 TaxID=2854029 RepID=UPI001CD1CB2E|nr:glycosyltransferase [Hasllibacter sp. MH4015]